MKSKPAIYTVLLAGPLLPILLNCKKEAIKTAPTVSITTATNVTATTASAGGDITADGGTTVTAKGICWSTNQSPTTSDSKTTNGTGIGSFIGSITGLTPGVTYNARAYATNSVGTGYSSQLSFTTPALAPVLATTDATAITSVSASSGGNITNDGGSAITARGVCWGVAQNPTTANSKTTDGAGSGIFTSAIAGLTPGTTYYVRAYATNSIGTSYGNQVTVIATAVLPTLTTTAISAITSTTATSGGNITSDGGGAITARGVCWSTTENPTTANSKTTDGSGTGIFTSAITGLTPDTTYYVRAYATNSIVTSFGSQITFTTSQNLSLATVMTLPVTDITATTATLSGFVMSEGNYAVTDRGTCFSTSPNPTTALNKFSKGTGTGFFSSDITGLTPNTTYYVRAYSTNNSGTAYGIEVSFKTLISSIIFNPNLPYGTMRDIDGNVYKTITIGTQTWMAENLKTTKYRNGDPIPNVTNGTTWADIYSTTGAYCWYLNAFSNKDILGGLYNFYAVFDSRNIAPAGWHVPTDAEWTTLKDYLGGGGVAGGKLKEAGISHWGSPNIGVNIGATNSSGFTALPCGGRYLWGGFHSFRYYGQWWSSTEGGSADSWSITLLDDRADFLSGNDDKRDGKSVRCVRDSPATVLTTSISAITSTTATSGGSVSNSSTARGVCWSTSQNPTIANNKTTDGTGVGSFTSNLSALAANTTYYVRAYSTYSAGTVYGNEVSFKTTAASGTGTVTDIDGNVYHTVTIGTQVWMVENLKTTKYRNGDAISYVTGSWVSLVTGAYCWYNNDAANKTTYGGLYNWYAVADSRNIAPTGWHVATDAEWTKLTTYLGGESVAGGKLKETGTTHWSSPNAGATSSGFAALPGGYRDAYDDSFDYVGYAGYWWSSTARDAALAWPRGLDYDGADVTRNGSDKRDGFSVRCVRDQVCQ